MPDSSALKWPRNPHPGLNVPSRDQFSTPGKNVELVPDKPVDAKRGVNFDAEIPPIDSLRHLRAVRDGGFHHKQLDKAGMGTELMSADMG
jgi:hypothetical protein